VIRRDPTKGFMLLSLPLWSLQRDAAGGAQQGGAVNLICAVVGGGQGDLRQPLPWAAATGIALCVTCNA
jgi:hypothetical protein